MSSVVVGGTVGPRLAVSLFEDLSEHAPGSVLLGLGTAWLTSTWSAAGIDWATGRGAGKIRDGEGHPSPVTENVAAFPPGLDRTVQHTSGQAVFGRDVLSTLVDELQRAAGERRTDRNWCPGVLGCAMWMDDPELIEVLGRMANACIVVTKQGRKAREKPKWATLTELAEKIGLLQSAFSELSELAVRDENGNPIIVGPYAGDWTRHTISGVRELGFRKVGNHLVPIVHAKILLLGDMFWTDEHPSGFVEDIYGFRPRRLWIGSANFTESSRSSLEMGLWTEDPAMLVAARKWLLALVELSEPLGGGPDVMDPELLPVEYDDAAIAEYMREVGWFSGEGGEDD